MSDSLRPHESQHARPSCPSSTPRVHWDSRPSSQWCHPAISSSVIPFSSCPQSLPASESFPMSQLFAWGGQSTSNLKFGYDKATKNFVQRDRGGKYKREVNRHEIWLRSSSIHLVSVPEGMRRKNTQEFSWILIFMIYKILPKKPLFWNCRIFKTNWIVLKDPLPPRKTPYLLYI